MKEDSFLPYIGHKGWVSLKTRTSINWEEVRELVVGSYRRVALRRILGAMKNPETALD